MIHKEMCTTTALHTNKKFTSIKTPYFDIFRTILLIMVSIDLDSYLGDAFC